MGANARRQIGYAKHRSRSHDVVIRVYDAVGNVTETRDCAGEFREGGSTRQFTGCSELRKGKHEGQRTEKSNARVTFYLFQRRNFQIQLGFYSLERNKVMNWKNFVLTGCVVACVFAASTATAQRGGHGNSMGRMGMRGTSMPRSMGRMPMHRGPMMNSPSSFRHFAGRDFDRDDRFRRFNHFNRFDRDDRFHRFNHFNNVVFIGDFGFPWWWGWGWGPWWGWNWGYPYGYYGGYGSGYGYGDSSPSRVTALQSRLARAGYYHGAIDGIMGPATRRAIRAYERDHGQGG